MAEAFCHMYDDHFKEIPSLLQFQYSSRRNLVEGGLFLSLICSLVQGFGYLDPTCPLFELLSSY